MGMPQRRVQIFKEICALDAQVLCLQEFADVQLLRWIKERGLYSCFHRNEAEGLLVLSQYPVDAVYLWPFAAAVQIKAQGREILIVNLHLPWDGALKRENAIVGLVAQALQIQVDFIFFCGDFNCSADSAVQHFLLGDQSLLGCETCFFDLAEAYASISGVPAPCTLDFRKNPRWQVGQAKAANTIERNQRFDRILLRNPYPADFPFLKEVGIFGERKSVDSGYAPSDHYGVYAQLVW